ncbi:MAG: hypothetical protein B6I23_02800 [Rickettsiaceae bacterium 4572_127]|nr:MAG: hypothetical protein B6I23_02800 [Rickettsiaceae bacterium 4572_127]
MSNAIKNNCVLDSTVKLKSLNELYENKLTDAELCEASANLMDFFNVLIEIKQDQMKKGGAVC